MTSSPPLLKGSYSFFSELENCPKKAQHVRVLRDIQRVETAEQRWGNYVHDCMEKRVGDGVVLEEDVAEFEPFARAFDQRTVYAEMKLAITTEGMPTEFYAKDAMVSGKVDVVVLHENRVDITDWKTGKDKYENPFELELHALLLAANGYTAESYTGRYVYLGLNKVGQTYDLSNVSATWGKVTRYMAQARAYQEKGGEWPATPNPLCGYCPVLQCRHNKVKQRTGQG